MGFLAPLAWLLGLAVTVPLILHLFQRQQGPRMVFPALRYLRRAEKENARRIRLRQFLLLALRLLAILLLAFAAARPFIRSGGAGHVPTAVAIVLDNSLSSGAVIKDRRVLDMLKDRALETLARATPDDRFWLIRAGTTEPALSGDATAIAERVRETDVAAGAGDITAAIAHARAVLAAGADKRAPEIQLLSDLQANGFHAPLDAGRNAPPLVVWDQDTPPPANAAVGSVLVGGGLPPRAGERSTVAASLVGSNTGDTVGVRLSIDTRVAAATRAPIGSAAILTFPARAAGLVSGWVDIDADALHADDRRYFVADVQPPPSVALAQPIPFVGDALGVLVDAGRVRRAAPGDAQVVIAPGGVGSDALNNGRTVVILAPESQLELPAINRRLAEAGVPWRFNAPAPGGEARFAPGEVNDELNQALLKTQLRQFYILQKQGNSTSDTVLVKLQDGSPWIVRGDLPSKARYLVVASPLSTAASTLPTSSAMVPLLDRLVGAWAETGATSHADVVPGQVVQLPPGADEVEAPLGKRDRVRAGEPYRAGSQAGIYKVYAQTKLVSAFAVNAPLQESALQRISNRRLKDVLPSWDIETSNDPAEWTRDIFRHRLGREIWQLLVALALILLLVEAMAASAGKQRRALDPDSEELDEELNPLANASAPVRTVQR